MWPYILTFLFSISLTYFVEKKEDRLGYIKYLLIFLVLFIPSLLAGFRDLNIGTDVKNYVFPLNQFAKMSNSYSSFLRIPILKDGFRLTEISSYEKGYTLLVFLTSKVTKGIFANFFITEFIIISCYFFGLWILRRNIPVWLGMSTFFAFFYNVTFNLVRQSIAMSILFLGFCFFFKKKRIIYIICLIIAITFHTTAIIGIIPVFINLFLVHNEKYDQIKIIFILLLSALIIYVPSILNSFISMFHLSNYINGYLSGNISVSWNQIFMQLPLIIFICLRWRQIDNNRYFYLAMALITLLVTQLTTASTSSGRISLYFFEYYILIIPNLFNKKLNVNRKGQLIKLIVLLFEIIYWIIYFVIFNYNATIPYIFSNNILLN